MTKNVGTVLVAYDGSVDADLALEWAAREARSAGLRLKVVVVRDTTLTPWPPYEGESELEWVSRAELLVKELGFDDAHVELRPGRIVPTVAAAAEGTELVVVGSRGHTAAGELFIGSVS